MVQSFEDVLEEKKRIFETGWHTFLYLIKHQIDPTPENYAKFFKKFLENPPEGDNIVKKVVKKTDKVLGQTKESLEEIETGLQEILEKKLVTVVNNLIEKVEKDKLTIEQLQKEIKKLEEELEAVRKDKYIDPLTGIWNRLALYEYLNELPKIAMEHNVVVAFIDLNKFKQINDTYGHLVGDQILKFFTKYILQNLKRKDFLARYGGDEFVAILFDIDLENAKKLFERLRKEIPPLTVNGKVIKIDFCVGLTVPFGNDTPEELLARADEAMYLCKKTGNVEIKLK